MKLFTKPSLSIYQPSITTKKIILKGRDIITGGSIIIPILINVAETIISIIRKGRNIKKPISKARLSSLIINAGSRIFSSIWVAVSANICGCSAPPPPPAISPSLLPTSLDVCVDCSAISLNRAISLLLVFSSRRYLQY